MALTIRPLGEDDRAAWEPLWRGYLEFYETEVAPEVADTTWARLMDAEFGIYGLGAGDGGELLGFVHYLYHPVTWSIPPRCYLEDLFTAKTARGKGVGRALIEAVYEAADRDGADQVYWLTQEFNYAGRILYDKVAIRTPFIKYQR